VPSSKISTKDTYIITPAENPKEPDKNFILVILALRTAIPPSPVDIPAKSVSKKAKNIFDAERFIYFSLILNFDKIFNQTIFN